MSLTDLLIGMFTPAQFCALLGISDRTYRRWNQDTHQIPAAVLLWLHIRRGHLDQYGEAWAGWHINQKTGELVSPSGVGFHASQIEHMGLAFQESALLRADNAKLRKQVAELKRAQAPARPVAAGGAKVIKFPG